MLQVIVFVCGAALMGLEFLAARMLAPTLGSSLYVWGAVISIVMVALALGYWLGGQLADRLGGARTLAPVIAIAAAFTMAIPQLEAWVLPPLTDVGVRSGALLASAVVFFVPCLLLAMVSPLAVRLATDRVEHVGRSAGSLYAISTAGSIAGTLATAFWLIPLLSLDTLVIAIGFTLMAAAIAGWILSRRLHDPSLEDPSRWASVLNRITWSALVIGVGIAALSLLQTTAPGAPALLGERIIYQRDTAYHRLYVSEDTQVRTLRFDKSRQSSMYLSDPYSTNFQYPYYLHLAMAAKPDAKRVLIVGLGGGSAVKRFWRDYPEMQVDVVEIDPVVVDVAKRYFALPDDERIDVTVEDGRRFLQASTAKYDIIIMDAYYADAIPFHLTTEEFFRVAKKRLAPDGVLAYNTIGAIEGPKSKLVRSMYGTASGVWKRLFVFPIGIGADGATRQNRNVIVLGTDAPVSASELSDRIENRVSGRVTVPAFETYAEDLWTEPIKTDDVPVLTDQHAPVDSLIDVN